MTTLTLNLPDERFRALKKESYRLNLAPEEFVNLIVDTYFSRPQDKVQEVDENFQDAMKYVLEKNAELYQRLAA
ncbi:MAG: DNA-binding protein [Chloroflexi bacterium]|nr:MAG: DNA-binding protein [Chloroflexota bacterium]